MKVRRLLRYYAALKGGRAATLDRDDRRTGSSGWAWPTWADKKVEALSKGMSQKVQFIATVVARPELVLLDEPFSGLDPVNADVLREAVLELRRDGTTVIFSTHDMGVAEQMCDFIFMIYQGRKVLDGTLEEIQARYGSDTVRVRTDGGRAALAGLPGVEAVSDFGNLQELRLTGRPAGASLRALIARDRGAPLRGDAAVAARHLRPHRPAGRRCRADRGGGPMMRGEGVTVAVTEFQNAVRSKAFVIGILLMPSMGGAVGGDPEVRRRRARQARTPASPSSTRRAGSIRCCRSIADQWNAAQLNKDGSVKGPRFRLHE